MEAARIAAIHDEIRQMPMGYETLVAEGGTALSGGQRQRIALARAVAHHPAILVLDEATSHLDTVTEDVVEQNLRGLSCTRMVIAHRLNTARNADLILALDNGTIVERGSHQELLAREGYYAQLVQSQLAEREIVKALLT
jgi:ABC-type bacteriocin/lantibiotic exporter with double-glycine peptidase domain